MTTGVLHLLGSSRPSASATQLQMLMSAAADSPETMRVLALDAAELFGKTVTVRRLPPTRLLDSRRWRAVRLRYAELQPRIIHTWGIAPTAAAVIARLAGHAGPLIVGVRRVEPAWNWPASRWLRRLARPIDRWVVPDESLISDVNRLAGRPEAIVTIADAIPDVNSLHGMSRHDLRQAIGASDTAHIALCAARLDHGAALKDLIYTIDMLRYNLYDVHLVIAGHGAWRERLQRFARQVRVGKRVHLLGDRANLAELLPHIDLYVQPGTVAAPTMAMRWAAAVHVPIVAAECAAAHRLLDPPSGGGVFRQGNRGDLAREMSRLLDDRALAAERARHAAARLLTDRQAARISDCYRALYSNVLFTT